MIKNLLNRNSIVTSYTSLINKINGFENSLKTLTDSELRSETFELKQHYQNEKDFSNNIAKSFAVVREASFRTLGLRHFDVQLLGGLVLNDGKIAEMKTGEGKTLVATLPAYLNSLGEKGFILLR